MHHPPRPEGSSGLLQALAMPFRLASLLFVVLTSILLAIMAQLPLLAIAGIWITLVWITHYALQLIDDAANGQHDTRAASVEMANPFSDTRALVHPALAVALGAALLNNPEWPRLPVLLGAALLFPASLGACALSGRTLDAFNPVEMARVIRGLGPWYAVVVLAMAACGMAGMLLAGRTGWLVLDIALMQLLILLVYACIGGALFLRRHELDFEPRTSPERIDDQQRAERLAARQRFIDELYGNLRVRESAHAIATATAWLRQAGAARLQDDVHALLEAGKHWNEPREYPRLLRALVPVLQDMHQPALALQVAEACLRVWPQYAPDSEADATSLVTYALQTGRRREAARLLQNYLQRAGEAAPGGPLQALCTRLQDIVPG